LAERPAGGAPTNALDIGLTYAKGPIILGATVGIIDSQGDARLTDLSQRHEFELAVGGAYKLAPGVQLVGEYQYAHRHQGGFDFNQGAPGLNGATRDARLQGVTFATVLAIFREQYSEGALMVLHEYERLLTRASLLTKT
jgi:predicted porin